MSGLVSDTRGLTKTEYLLLTVFLGFVALGGWTLVEHFRGV